MKISLGTRRLVVDRSPGCVLVGWRERRLCEVEGIGQCVLEEEDMWFWLVDFIVLPSETLWHVR